jgi:N-methylhydantoinase A
VESDVSAIFEAQKQTGCNELHEQAAEIDDVEVFHEVDLVHEGQVHLFRVSADEKRFDAGAVRRRFDELYRARFSINFPEMRAILVNLRTSVFGRRPRFPLEMLAPDISEPGRAYVSRNVWFNGQWIATPIYKRDDLASDQILAGPAIVEQADTTVVIEPGWVGRIDRIGNIRIDRAQ